MPWKFKNFNCEEDDHAQSHSSGKVMIREHQGQLQMNEPGGGAGWVALVEDTGPDDFGPIGDDDFAYVVGKSRWVYINGKWYKIG